MQKLSLTNKYTPYSNYKRSQVEWIAQIPEGWEIKKIRRMFQIKKRIAGKLDIDVLSITQKGIKVKNTKDNEGQLSADYSKYQLVEKGDFAMNQMDLLTGYVDISKYDGVTSPDYRVFTRRETSTHDRYFLYLFQMGYHQKLFYPFGRGAAQLGRWRFPAGEFNNFFLPVPPKDEQEKIARFLDEQTARIDETIIKKQKLIELLKEKRTTVINHSVTKGLDPKAELVDSCIGWIGKIPKGWSVKRLGLVTKISASNVDKLTEEGQKIVRVCNYVDVYKNEYITEDLNFVNASASAPQVSKFSLLSGDILLTKDSETANDIGVPAFVPINIEGAVVGYHIYQARVTDKTLLPEFLFRYLQSSFANAWFENKARGVTRFGLGSHGVKSLPILGPTHNEQTEIASFIRQQTDIVDKAKNQIEKSILLLQELKSSLISHAVTGKIKI